ncbi:segregation and condensation protein A [Methanospirillum lacunae]|uniref:Segregation/condensation protein A n=1 Tax=Methanospirillum lacunae TaxID=668570 RepID=A0A2V2MUR7_9EURY|nr:ScpA family protein [Methanospirillum lacunae]PWR71924.1 segregation/condensation protein A [Methanospirillum lacunae]
MIEDPVEILVQMAERGEIDPWNVNIIEVTDRFFTEMEKQRTLDLRVSGRTLFYAATLLRIKSDYLAVEEEDPIPEDDGEIDEGDGDYGSSRVPGNPILLLEHEIVRRLDRKSMRKQPITLYDLIALLRNAEKEDRRRQRDSWVRDDGWYAEDIVSIAHEEGYHESTDDVLLECFGCIERQDTVTLRDVAARLGWPISQVYIPLLFLMHDGKVGLRQEQMFGELYIEKHAGDPAA